MTFEIGDKVRLTGLEWKGGGDCPEPGSVHEIIGFDCEGDPKFTWDGDDWSIDTGAWSAELVTEGEDLINDPSHYRQGGIAVHAVLDAYGLDKKHYLASATEYILRSGFKGTEESDLRKAVWHLNHYIEQHFGGEE